MKFIFPKNYNFNSKLFGIFDYTTLIISIIYYFFIFSCCNLFLKNINLKIFIFISFCFPIFIFSIVGLNNENIIGSLLNRKGISELVQSIPVSEYYINLNGTIMSLSIEQVLYAYDRILSQKEEVQGKSKRAKN